MEKNWNVERTVSCVFWDYREKLDSTIFWSYRLQFNFGEWSGNVCDFSDLVNYRKTEEEIN